MGDPLVDFVDQVCVQTAVLWKNPLPDRFGEYEFDDAIEIYCRWDGKQQQIVDENGDEIVSVAEILLHSQASTQVGEYIMLGVLEDLETNQINDPLSVSNAYRIKNIQSTPLFQSTDQFIQVAYI